MYTMGIKTEIFWGIKSIYNFILIGLTFLLITCNKSDETTNSSSDTQDTTPLSYFSIFPDTLVAAVGEPVEFTITAIDTSGSTVINVLPQYSSSNSSVISIQPDGRINAVGVGQTLLTANAGGKSANVYIYIGSPTYDLTSQGIPKFCNANYIDISKIARISRFRSTIGHSYVDSDTSETCRSMKHYYEPKSSVDWTKVDVYAPVSGSLVGFGPDGRAGYQLRIRPRDVPAFDVILFHVNTDSTIKKGKWISAGEYLGTHSSSTTLSDISVSNGGKEQGHLISYFLVMTDEVFELYQARGVASRQAAIITKEERDNDEVPCVGEQAFTVHGTIPDWLDLN